MVRKRFLCALCAAAIFTAAGCGGGGNENASPADAAYTLSEFSFSDAEYGEFYKFDLSSIKVLDENGAETDLSAGILEIVWPSGKKTRLAGNSLKLTETGEYTVNYTVKGTNLVFPRKLDCKDTKGPAISLGESIFIPKTAVIGQKVMIPEATASDLSGVSERVAVSVKGPDGEDVPIETDRFTTKKAGAYSLEYLVRDNNGNIGTRTQTITVFDVKKEEGVVGYTHLPYGVEQNAGMYRHEDYIVQTFLADVTKKAEKEVNGVAVTAGGISALPDGSKAATLVTPSDNVQRVTYCVNSAIDDFTDYDYVGMWVYNDSPKNVRINLNYRGANEFYVKPRTWTYVAFNINAFDYSEKAICGYNDTGMPVLQKRDSIRQVTFRFDYEWSENEFFENDDYGYRQKGYADLDFDLYLGKIEAGRFDGAAGGFDKPSGAAFYTGYAEREYPVVADAVYSYTSDEAMKEFGAAGATVFENVYEREELSLRVYMLKGAQAGKKYKLWIKNPNAYTVVFDDGNDNVTAIPAGAELLVSVTPYDAAAEEWKGAGLYNAKIRAESGKLPGGAKLCLGALREA